MTDDLVLWCFERPLRLWCESWTCTQYTLEARMHVCACASLYTFVIICPFVHMEITTMHAYISKHLQYTFRCTRIWTNRIDRNMHMCLWLYRMIWYVYWFSSTSPCWHYQDSHTNLWEMLSRVLAGWSRYRKESSKTWICCYDTRNWRWIIKVHDIEMLTWNHLLQCLTV